MRLLLFLLLLLLIPAAHAQSDIGELVFRNILQVNDYPGSPFTGVVINDLVMFFFIPTVFIIVIIYTLVGRLTDDKKIKLLMGIAFYLFIIFGGYFRIFMLLAGPYFLFLIIILGIVFFFLGHFGLGRGHALGGGSGAGGHGLSGTSQSDEDLLHELDLYEDEYKRVKRELDSAMKRVDSNPKMGIAMQQSLGAQQEELARIRTKIMQLQIDAARISPRGRAATRARVLREKFKF
jgi:hypothetical protein